MMILAIFLFLTTANADTTISVTRDNGMDRPLGNGYNSRQQSLKAQCVEGRPSTDFPDEGSVSQGSISLRMVADQSSLAEKLGFSIGGKAQIGLVNASASAEYYNDSLSTGLSLTYVYSADYLYHAYLVNRASSPVTIKPGVNHYLKEAKRWLDACGDEFVAAWNKGARLLITLRLDFISREEKSRFSAQFGAEGPLWSANGSFNTESANYSKKTRLTIRAMQMGGDPAKLGQAFCPSGAAGSCQGDSAKLVSCSFGDLGQCMEVMAGMIRYGNGQSGNDFPAQIHDFKNYVTLALETQPWSYLGAQFPLAPTPQEIANYEVSLSELSDLFNENHLRWVTATRFAANKAPRLSFREQDQMAILAARLKNNMSVIAESTRICYETPLRCASSVLNTKDRIQFGTADYPTDATIEALLAPETYAQFCDRIAIEPSLKPTIQALDQIAFEKSGLSSQDWSSGDPCKKAEDILTHLEKLDVSGKDIRDLRPIATLTGLRSLNLSRNRIDAIDELANLKQLRDLQLDDNHVSDLRPLASLQGLEMLSLQNNRLTSVESLRDHPRLRHLDLRRNRGHLACPLTDPAGCLAFDYASQSFFIPLNTTGSHPIPRIGQASIVLSDGSILITGGMMESGETANFGDLRRASSLSFQSWRGMKYGRVQHTMTLLADRCQILVAGGGRFGDTFEVLNSCPEHSGRPWSSRSGTLAVSRTGHTATLLTDGRVLLVGGWTEGVHPFDHRNDATDKSEIYDPITGASTPTGSMHTPRAMHAATLLQDGRVLISGGYLQNEGIQTMEIFDPATSRFEKVEARLSTGRSGHSSTLLGNGLVLIAGGYSLDNQASTTAELFDPRTSKRVSLLPMEKAHASHVAQLLENGQVLIAGGLRTFAGGMTNQFQHRESDGIADAEIFDPATRRFNIINQMSQARGYPISAPLGRKRVLIFGGMGSPGAADSAELFDYGYTGE